MDDEDKTPLMLRFLFGEADTRRLVEEIASMRYLLRNAFRLAIETEETRERMRTAGKAAADGAERGGAAGGVCEGGDRSGDPGSE